MLSELTPDNRVGTSAIDLFSGNAKWEKPLAHLNGRANLNLDLKLVYNSLLWTDAGNEAGFDLDIGSPAPGFRLGLPVMRALPSSPGQGAKSYIYIDSSGRRTELKQVNEAREFRATDASLLSFVEGPNGGTVYDAAGLKFDFARSAQQLVCTRVEDRSGNYITATYNAGGRVTSIEDTVGRSLAFTYDAAGKLAYIEELTGQSARKLASFNYAPVTITPPFKSAMVSGPNIQTPVTLLSDVSLSDGHSYSFSYTGAGEMERISHQAPDRHTLGYVEYAYAAWTNSASKETPRVANVSEWVEATDDQRTMATVTAPDSSGKGAILRSNGNSTVEQFGTTGWQRGLTLTREDRSANGTVARSTTTWQKVPDGQTSFHIVPQLITSSGTATTGTAPFVSVSYDSLGRRQDVKTTLPDGQVESNIHTSYVDSAPYIRQHILNLVDSVFVTDEKGAVRHRTTYSYDETGAVTTQASVIHHNSVGRDGQNVRIGLATTVTRECPGCTDARQHPARSLHMTYNSTGTLATFQADGGASISYNYDDNFGDEQQRASFAYPTTTQIGPQTAVKEYDFASGRPVLRRGIDGESFTYSYDESGRVRQTTDLNSGTTLSQDYGVDGRTTVATTQTAAGAQFKQIKVTDGAKRLIASAMQSLVDPSQYVASFVARDGSGRRTAQVSRVHVDADWRALDSSAVREDLLPPSVMGTAAPAVLFLSLRTALVQRVNLLAAAIMPTVHAQEYGGGFSGGDGYSSSGDSWFSGGDYGYANYDTWTNLADTFQNDNATDFNNDPNVWNEWDTETDQTTTAQGQGQAPSAYQSKIDGEMASSGYDSYLSNTTWESTDSGYTGQVSDPEALANALQNDPNFACGVLYGAHLSLGARLVDCRSYTDVFGPGSLQIVFSRDSGNFHYDVDRFNPYQDVVNFLGHAFVEFLPHLFGFKN